MYERKRFVPSVAMAAAAATEQDLDDRRPGNPGQRVRNERSSPLPGAAFRRVGYWPGREE
jgi:hypothetical protein